MQEILYVKISNERCRHFQIITEVYEEKGRRYVRKKALHEEGKLHIQNIINNKKILQKKYSDCADVQVCECKKQGDSVVFDYIIGKRFDQYFTEICAEGNGEKIIEVLEQYNKILLPMKDTDVFEKSPDFIRVFGDVDLESNQIAGTNVNVDMIFGNLFWSEKYFVIDYEWVFPFSVPLEYVFCKALFTSVAFSMLDAKVQEEVYKHFHLNETKRNMYMQMEKNFQMYVKKDRISFSALTKKFQLKCIGINENDIERQGYFIKCFGKKDARAEEIYDCMVQSGFNCLEFSIENASYDSIEIFCAPTNCVITVESILGYKNGKGECVQYTTTKEYEESGAEYYGSSTPVFIIENHAYDKIVCKYDIQVWDNQLVSKFLEQIECKKNIYDELERTQQELQNVNNELNVSQNELYITKQDLNNIQEVLTATEGMLIEKSKELEEKQDKIDTLENEHQVLRGHCIAIEEELNNIKNSRSWKMIQRIGTIKLVQMVRRMR